MFLVLLAVAYIDVLLAVAYIDVLLAVAYIDVLLAVAYIDVLLAVAYIDVLLAVAYIHLLRYVIDVSSMRPRQTSSRSDSGQRLTRQLFRFYTYQQTCVPLYIVENIHAS